MLKNEISMNLSLHLCYLTAFDFVSRGHKTILFISTVEKSTISKICDIYEFRMAGFSLTVFRKWPEGLYNMNTYPCTCRVSTPIRKVLSIKVIGMTIVVSGIPQFRPSSQNISMGYWFLQTIFFMVKYLNITIFISFLKCPQ